VLALIRQGSIGISGNLFERWLFAAIDLVRGVLSRANWVCWTTTERSSVTVSINYDENIASSVASPSCIKLFISAWPTRSCRPHYSTVTIQCADMKNCKLERKGGEAPRGRANQRSLSLEAVSAAAERLCTRSSLTLSSAIVKLTVASTPHLSL
jgi:hypothetical protein